MNRSYPSLEDLHGATVFFGWVFLADSPEPQQVLMRHTDSNTFDLVEHEGQKVLCDSVKYWSPCMPMSLSVPQSLCVNLAY